MDRGRCMEALPELRIDKLSSRLYTSGVASRVLTPGSYRQLDPEKLIATLDVLIQRIRERFPDCGLGSLVKELRCVADEAIERTEWIGRPIIPLRVAVALLVAMICAVAGRMAVQFNLPALSDLLAFIQFFEAGLSSIVFIGAAMIFLVSCETRIKRMKALRAIHELRSMAHIVDMHQLTKDPDRYFFGATTTDSSPKRLFTAFELGRYLDYCSETLSLISKISALYVQNFEDQVVLDAVDEIEALTAGLSRKIWQKIALLEKVTDKTAPA